MRHISVHLSIGFPLVVTEGVSNRTSSAEEGFISSSLDLPLEAVHQCLDGVRRNEGLSFQIVIVFGLDVHADEFAAMTRLRLFVHAPSSVLEGTINSVTLNWGCFDHLMLFFCF